MFNLDSRLSLTNIEKYVMMSSQVEVTFMNNWQSTFFSIVVATALSVPSLSMAESSLSQPQLSQPKHTATLYGKLYTALQTKCHIPVLLPPASYLNAIFDFNKVLSLNNLIKATANSYIIRYDWTNNCNGAPICNGGYMYASRIDSHMPYNSHVNYPVSKYALLKLINQSGKETSLNHYKKVALTNGTYAYLEKNNYNSPYHAIYRTIIWNDENNTYQLTLKNTDDETFINLANQTISTGQTEG